MSSNAHSSISGEDASPSNPSARPTAAHVSRLLLWVAGVVLVWFLVSEGATEAWYRWREMQVSATVPWQVHWPTEEDAAKRGFLGFQSREMTDREQELLKYHSARTASWRDTAGNLWTGFLLEWESDKRLNQSDINHNPTACLPAAGLKMVRERETVIADMGGQTLRFRAWEFAAGSQPVFVYLGVRRDRNVAEPVYTRDAAGRIRAFFDRPSQGLRGNPLQLMELIVVGPRDGEQADQALVTEVSRLFAVPNER